MIDNVRNRHVQDDQQGIATREFRTHYLMVDDIAGQQNHYAIAAFASFRTFPHLR
jgi:hypothetical protein